MPAKGQQTGASGYEQEADDGKGDLLCQVSLGAAAEHGEVAPHPRPDERPWHLPE